MRGPLLCAVLLLAMPMAAQTQPQASAPAAQDQQALASNTALFEALTPRFLAANEELSYMACERAWQRTSWWRRWRGYGWNDPCRWEAAQHQDVLDRFHIVLTARRRGAWRAIADVVGDTVTTR